MQGKSRPQLEAELRSLSVLLTEAMRTPIGVDPQRTVEIHLRRKAALERSLADTARQPHG